MAAYAATVRPTCSPQGVLLQIFTKPLGDRPTVFFEIIERLCSVTDKASPGKHSMQAGGAGDVHKRDAAATRAPCSGLAGVHLLPCAMLPRNYLICWPPQPSALQPSPAEETASPRSRRAAVPDEVGGCGGFGKGNFRWVGWWGWWGCAATRIVEEAMVQGGSAPPWLRACVC